MHTADDEEPLATKVELVLAFMQGVFHAMVPVGAPLPTDPATMAVKVTGCGAGVAEENIGTAPVFTVIPGR
jgi:hypothetical protein